MYFLQYFCHSAVLSGIIWQELEPELAPKLWKKVEPVSEQKINNFSSAKLIYIQYNDLADLAILWSKLADLGNLGILTLLADLADWKPIFFLADMKFSGLIL